MVELSACRVNRSAWSWTCGHRARNTPSCCISSIASNIPDECTLSIQCKYRGKTADGLETNDNDKLVIEAKIRIKTLGNNFWFAGSRRVLQKRVKHSMNLVTTRIILQQLASSNSYLYLLQFDIFCTLEHSPSPLIIYSKLDTKKLYFRLKFLILFENHVEIEFTS